jgi:hypothetical protein
MIRLALFSFQLRWLAGRLFRRLCLLAVCVLLAVLLLIFWREALSRGSLFFAKRRRQTMPKLSAEQWKIRKAWHCWFKLREELSRQRVEQLRDQWQKETVL